MYQSLESGDPVAVCEVCVSSLGMEAGGKETTCVTMHERQLAHLGACEMLPAPMFLLQVSSSVSLWPSVLWALPTSTSPPAYHIAYQVQCTVSVHWDPFPSPSKFLTFHLLPSLI